VTVVVASSEALFRAARAHLRGHIEQVGFFLADFDAEEGAFVLREWRPMPPPEVIKWAGDSFDALAWLDDEKRPVQVTAFEVDGVALAATARTLPRLRELREPYG